MNKIILTIVAVLAFTTINAQADSDLEIKRNEFVKIANVKMESSAEGYFKHNGSTLIYIFKPGKANQPNLVPTHLPYIQTLANESVEPIYTKMMKKSKIHFQKMSDVKFKYLKVIYMVFGYEYNSDLKEL